MSPLRETPTLIMELIDISNRLDELVQQCGGQAGVYLDVAETAVEKSIHILREEGKTWMTVQGRRLARVADAE